MIGDPFLSKRHFATMTNDQLIAATKNYGVGGAGEGVNSGRAWREIRRRVASGKMPPP
jgi:hypothetical protein